jgi:hypothetical protein
MRLCKVSNEYMRSKGCRRQAAGIVKDNYFLGGFGLPGLSFLVIVAPNYKCQQMSSRPASQIHLLLSSIVCERVFFVEVFFFKKNYI